MQAYSSLIVSSFHCDVHLKFIEDERTRHILLYYMRERLRIHLIVNVSSALIIEVISETNGSYQIGTGPDRYTYSYCNISELM